MVDRNNRNVFLQTTSDSPPASGHVGRKIVKVWIRTVLGVSTSRNITYCFACCALHFITCGARFMSLYLAQSLSRFALV